MPVGGTHPPRVLAGAGEGRGGEGRGHEQMASAQVRSSCCHKGWAQRGVSRTCQCLGAGW